MGQVVPTTVFDQQVSANQIRRTRTVLEAIVSDVAIIMHAEVVRAMVGDAKLLPDVLTTDGEDKAFVHE